MDDDIKIAGENDEEDIDPRSPSPILDADEDLDAVEDPDLAGTEVPVSKAAKAGLLGDDVDAEDLEDEDDDSDPLEDDFNADFEDEM